MNTIRTTSARIRPTRAAGKPARQAGTAIAHKTALKVTNPDALPNRYAVICDGTCMEPEIPDGAPVLVDKRGKLERGDLVLLFFKPEHVPAGRHHVILKRIVMPPPSYVTFPWREHPKSDVHALVIVEMSNPRRQFAYKCEHLLGIHRCLGVAPDVPIAGQNSAGVSAGPIVTRVEPTPAQSAPGVSRRSIVMNTIVTAASVASASAVASPSLSRETSATTPRTDDTLARISEHRRLRLVVEDICERQSKLEAIIPRDRQKFYRIEHRGTDIGKDDDPRWTAIQMEYWTASDAQDEIAWSFCDRPATSIEGMRGILGYAAEEEGWEWPDARHHYSAAGRWEGCTEEDWRSSLMKALAGQARMLSDANLGCLSDPLTESIVNKLRASSAIA